MERPAFSYAVGQRLPTSQHPKKLEFVGIPPEEDMEVPGTYLDALNPNTKLGKAVRAAVDELNHLNALAAARSAFRDASGPYRKDRLDIQSAAHRLHLTRFHPAALGPGWQVNVEDSGPSSLSRPALLFDESFSYPTGAVPGLRNCLQALKSQLHDGLIGADLPSSHADSSRSALGIPVSLQHLPTRPPEIQHTLPLHGAASHSDGTDLPTLQLQERPVAGDGGECSCDCEPSTSTGDRIDDGLAGNRRWRSQHVMNSRDAAALTRRITHTQSVSELHEVLRQYRSRLNPIHISAAIVKLAKLTAAEGCRKRPRQGLMARQVQQQGQEPPGGRQVVAADSLTATGQEGTELKSVHARHSSGAAVNVDMGGTPAVLADALRRVRRREDNWVDELVSSGSRTSTGGLSDQASGEQSGPGLDPDNTLGSHAPGSSDHNPAANVRLPMARSIDGRSFQPANADVPLAHPRQGQRTAASASPRTAQSSAALLADLVSGFLTQLPHYTARQYANVVWALGSMGSREHTELLHAAAVQLQAQGGAKLFAAPPQELSNLALGLAKLGYREVSLWGAIIAAGKARLHEFKPQELHNMAWAVAAASQDRSMISAAVQTALPQLRRFNASGLSNLLWACATAQCHCEELFDGAAAALMALPPHEMNCQDVANTAWACAKLQHNHPELMAHLARLVLAAAEAPGATGLRGANTQELANTLWAFAVLPLPLSMPRTQGMIQGGDGVDASGPEGMEGANCITRGVGAAGGVWLGRDDAGVGLLEQPQPQKAARWLAPQALSSGPPSGTSGMPDAVAALGSQVRVSNSSIGSSYVANNGCGAAGNHGGSGSSGCTSGLFESVVRVLVLELSQRPDLTPQGASNALWACARLQPFPLPPAGVVALTDATARCCGRMNDQEVANTLWALAELRSAGLHVPYGAAESIFTAACAASRLEVMAPAGLAQLMHGAVALRRVLTGEMDVLAQHVLRRLAAVRPQELCVMAVAVAEAVRVAKYCNPILLNGLANAAVACVGELCPQGISTLLWSFARAKHYHGPLTTTLCRAAKPRLGEFSDMEISNLVWALAILKCQDRQLLVQAARVLVERVRLRRQRRAATLRRQQHAVSPQVPRTPAQQQEASVRGQSLMSLEQTGGEVALEGDEEDLAQPREQLSQLLLSERTEMALALASHRQQQRRRRQQQKQQQQQRQFQESEQLGSETASVGYQQVRAEVATDSERKGLTDTKLWARAGWEAYGLRQQNAAEPDAPGVGVGTVPEALAYSVGDSGSRTDRGSSSTVVAVAAVLPTHASTAEPLPSQPEPRLRLRRLPSLYHHDDADLVLQPRRPQPRDSSSEAGGVDSHRRGAAVTVASMPRCTGSLDAGGGGPGILTQRAVSPTDDADRDVYLGAADGGVGPTPCDHAKSMAKLLWSYAKCNLYNQSLFRLLVQELLPVLRHATPHELAQALWAVACHGHHCPDFLDAAAALMLRGRLRHLCAWDASVVAWAYAKLRYPHRDLFEALQEHARVAGDKYREPCLLRLAWACATMEVPMQDDLVRRVVDLKQQARRRAALSSYDGADGELPAAVDAARKAADNDVLCAATKKGGKIIFRLFKVLVERLACASYVLSAQCRAAPEANKRCLCDTVHRGMMGPVLLRVRCA
ncbi:hypothetical protein VOLCADRAFT_86282 [Volvox carteri f. nagariensis]|uniref:Uncharacterized protein n=1 Tax=Volvox carteri f. nagariensis TaxID=3068 RepID=D8TID4_VOLCA|nr:uncharacterized protein VOLCADRAFT_86282 [Volvox carteri f. nagariensis]EFJ52872.1 hypothetical protein VOLCADRAFT_86282 [Volvox carteri f. nagariensis]|eukprot:XP_002945877.1 hypothetical protein VOLCADRAFT_86282 [Volvox carteri f. nagariensis]